MSENPSSAVADSATGPKPRRTVPLLIALIVMNIGGYAAIAGILSVLLPSQVQIAAGADAVSTLGLITGISAIASVSVPPIVGLLSDRTRSRWGRRTPWIFFGGLAGAAAMLLLGTAQTVPLLLIGWFLVQGTLNIGLNVILAVIADGVPLNRRGLASALQGLGLPVGSIIGVQIGANLISDVVVAYVILIAVFVVASTVAAVLVREPASDAAVVEAKRRDPLLRSFSSIFSSLRDRDYRWVLIARAVLYLGYNMVSVYGLYILQDYIAMPADITPAAGVATMTTINLGTLVVTSLVIGPLVDRFGRHKRWVLFTGVLLAFAVFIPLFVPTWTGMLVHSAVLGLAFGAYLGVDLALAAITMPRTGDSGRDMGVFHIALNLPQVIAPFVASVAVTSLGGYRALFALSGAFALIGALAVLRVRRP
ncbi:MFS transporter [Microbacterium phyllosphaerae]|uniref:MFS transporter n=1 Tax=Microbacterium phyllosphaerae TaxID=124798 RepID=UPI003D64E980